MFRTLDTKLREEKQANAENTCVDRVLSEAFTLDGLLHSHVYVQSMFVIARAPVPILWSGDAVLEPFLI